MTSHLPPRVLRTHDKIWDALLQPQNIYVKLLNSNLDGSCDFEIVGALNVLLGVGKGGDQWATTRIHFQKLKDENLLKSKEDYGSSHPWLGRQFTIYPRNPQQPPQLQPQQLHSLGQDTISSPIPSGFASSAQISLSDPYQPQFVPQAQSPQQYQFFVPSYSSPSMFSNFVEEETWRTTTV